MKSLDRQSLPLVLSHIGPKRLKTANGGFSTRMVINPNFIDFSLGCPDRKKVGGGIRGEVKNFSFQARQRLRKKVYGALAVNIRSYFVTLTYPKNFPEFSDSKGDLRAVIKRIRRSFPGFVGVIWKLELQKRGAPHFHLIMIFKNLINPIFLREFIAVWWFCRNKKNGYLGYDNSPKYSHFVYGVRVDEVDNKRVGCYISKYISKGNNQKTLYVGRLWGSEGEIPDGNFYNSGYSFEPFRILKEYLEKTGNEEALDHFEKGGRVWFGAVPDDFFELFLKEF